jgi:hypothetical protein
VDTELSDGLPGFSAPSTSIGNETGPCPEPVRIGYRSFDRQWILPDKRLINQPNPTLWAVRSNEQIYLTGLQQGFLASGPTVTFTAEIPDLHHYRGNTGGRAFPLWLGPGATDPNVVPGLLEYLGDVYGRSVSAADLFAYLAAVLAQPEFGKTFAPELKAPGIRTPLTANPELFNEASDIGRQVLWLHSYGQRFTDPDDNRLKGSPRLPRDVAPRVLAGHPIPSDPEGMPDTLSHDPVNQELHVGTGIVENVTSRMWNYDVAGTNILTKWFSYRRKTRERPVMGDRRVSLLQAIQLESWPASYTSELIDLLNVLGLLEGLEPAQAQLLAKILANPLITVENLTEAHVLPVPETVRKPATIVGAATEPTLDLGL